MKSLRLLAVALLACACTASAALACDAHKSKSARNTTASRATTAKAAGATKAAHAAHAGCTAGAPAADAAGRAAACTPEMAAACMSNTAVAAATGCEAKGASATAVVAGNVKSGKAAKGADCCGMKGAATAVAANSKPAAAKGAAHDCSACADRLTCEQDVEALGAKSQVVALKNGAMIVYTTETPGDVKALQATVTKRHEKLMSSLAAGGSRSLCPECKALRGAIASGKLHREVVNVERGCMTLLTSSDQSVVTRIRAITGQPVAMR